MKKEKFPKISFLERIEELEKISYDQINFDAHPIIFDTNFLFVTFSFKIDIISELERLIGKTYSLYIYEGTLEELSNIEKKKDKNKKFLPLIATMLKQYNFKIIKSDISYIDDQILVNAQEGVLIATNDKQLRKTLWAKGLKVIYLRQKRYLEIK